MSHTWQQLNTAIHVLAGPGAPRERLFLAYAPAMIGLRRRDIPVEVHPTFDRLTLSLRAGRYGGDIQDVKTAIDVMPEVEVSAAIIDLITLHEAVAAYQPLYQDQSQQEQNAGLYRDCLAC
jgi:hypothetical protein